MGSNPQGTVQYQIQLRSKTCGLVSYRSRHYQNYKSKLMVWQKMSNEGGHKSVKYKLQQIQNGGYNRVDRDSWGCDWL